MRLVTNLISQLPIGTLGGFENLTGNSSDEI
jgi:hypothetical protein